MKKIILSLTLMIYIIFSSCICAYGYSGNNIIDGLDTAKEDLAPDYDIFFNEINRSVYGNTDSYLTDEDIDYTKILKTICDINIFEDETMTSEKMQKKLDEAEDYCYQLPIYRNGKTYVYTVGKGGPVREDIREYLTDDEIKRIESREGRWIYSFGQLIEKEIDYIEALNEMLEYNNIENAKVYVVGGIASGLHQLAVICCENGDVKVNIMEGVDENKEAAIILDKNYKLYSYEEIKALVDKIPPINPDCDDGFGYNSADSNNYTQYILFAVGAVIVLSVAAVTVVCIKKKKAKASAELSE